MRPSRYGKKTFHGSLKASGITGITFTFFQADLFLSFIVLTLWCSSVAWNECHVYAMSCHSAREIRGCVVFWQYRALLPWPLNFCLAFPTLPKNDLLVLLAMSSSFSGPQGSWEVPCKFCSSPIPVLIPFYFLAHYLCPAQVTLRMGRFLSPCILWRVHCFWWQRFLIVCRYHNGKIQEVSGPLVILFHSSLSHAYVFNVRFGFARFPSAAQPPWYKALALLYLTGPRKFLRSLDL